MEEIIEKKVTGRGELRVVEYLQCGRHCADVLYLVCHLIIKTHMLISIFFINCLETEDQRYDTTFSTLSNK